MTSPSLELQGAIITRLKAYSGLTAIVGTRIHDHVPTSPTFPYISIGPEQVVETDFDCVEGFEVFLQIDVWSRAVGFPEAKSVSEEVRKALHDYELPLIDNALVSIKHRQTRNLRDPDGLTSHSAIEFVALIEQP